MCQLRGCTHWVGSPSGAFEGLVQLTPLENAQFSQQKISLALPLSQHRLNPAPNQLPFHLFSEGLEKLPRKSPEFLFILCECLLRAPFPVGLRDRPALMPFSHDHVQCHPLLLLPGGASEPAGEAGLCDLRGRQYGDGDPCP